MDITAYLSKCRIIDDLTKTGEEICISSSELIIKNVVVIDVEGIFKADAGICEGRITKFGRADITGAGSCRVINGDGLVLTCGGVAVIDGRLDRHDAEDLLFKGYSTVIFVGDRASGTSEIVGELMTLPLNIGFVSEVCNADRSYISEAVSNGCCGLIVGNGNASRDTVQMLAERFNIITADVQTSVEKRSSGSLADEISARTVEPAKRFGLTAHVGAAAEGKLADLYLWRPETLFDVPEKIIKCGRCIFDRSITQRQDMIYAYLNYNNRAGQNSCAVFTSETAANGVFGEKLRPLRRVLTVSRRA